jgi:biotin synthase
MMSMFCFLDLAESIAQGRVPEAEDYGPLVDLDPGQADQLWAGATLLRERFCGRKIHLCTICNAKSGRCSEDCSFCAQSARAGSVIDEYPLMASARMSAGGVRAAGTPINRFSVVTSGRSLPSKEVQRVASALKSLSCEEIETCASLGVLGKTDLGLLKRAGVSRYHHNLETAASHYPGICSTHSYQDRLRTVQAAQQEGLSVCAGGLFGLGESDFQVLELALALKELGVDAIPVNFLVPQQGTRLQGHNHLTPFRCLKIISMLRYVMPDKEIIICGGREYNLGELHPLIYSAGASGVMTGDYLTTNGRSLAQDLHTLTLLGLFTRPKTSSRVFENN